LCCGKARSKHFLHLNASKLSQAGFQSFRTLIIFSPQNTSAREVVMLALQEFGITEYSSNYTLCEVKVDVS
jgi:hypothetical protein